MNDLVGDLLHVADLIPDISGVDRVSTVTSIPGLKNQNHVIMKNNEDGTLELRTDLMDKVCRDSKMFGIIEFYLTL